MTPRRLLNMLRCGVSYAVSLLKIVHIPHRPTFVAIEPANFCQLHCPECPVGRQMYQKTKQTFSPDLFAAMLRENGQYMHTVIFYFQGEPLLSHDLPTLIRMAKNAGLYTYLSTNLQALTAPMAQALIAAGIDHIVASIDGISEASYQAYRQGGTLQRALQGLRLLQEEKQRQHAHTHIEWQCLRLRTNEHEWASIRQQYKALGADSLTFKTAQFYNYREGNPLMPTEERYSRYCKQNDGTYRLRKHPHNACFRLWRGCVVDAAGNVLPCCYDKGSQYAFGNLHQQSWMQCWHSPQAMQFRRQVLAQRKNIPLCQHCTE